jgi:hypothetical protein
MSKNILLVQESLDDFTNRGDRKMPRFRLVESIGDEFDDEEDIEIPVEVEDDSDVEVKDNWYETEDEDESDDVIDPAKIDSIEAEDYMDDENDSEYSTVEVKNILDNAIDSTKVEDDRGFISIKDKGKTIEVIPIAKMPGGKYLFKSLDGQYKQIKLEDIVLTESLNENFENDDVDEELESVKNEARKISMEEGCVQHVNTAAGGKYKISDWYDDDTTLVSYENGEEL